MIKFNAAVLEKLNSPLIIEELIVPDLEFGQVLIKLSKSGICGAQINEMTGVKGEDRYLPHLMGHEGSGIVIELGPGVRNVKIGDHVVLHWRKGVGIDSLPPKYLSNSGKQIGGGWVTTFNEYSVVSENRLTSIDKDIPFESAALMGCAVTTALGLINNEAKLKIGQSVAIVGCGGVGLNLIQGATLVSANPIVAIDVIDSKLKLAKEFGATHTINLSEENFDESIAKIFGKSGVDVFIETSGKSNNIVAAYRNTSSNGKTIMVGQPHINDDLIFNKMVQNFTGKVLMDSQGGLTNPTVDIPRYLNLYKTGKLLLDKLITHRFNLEQVNLAISTIQKGEAIRCIIDLEKI